MNGGLEGVRRVPSGVMASGDWSDAEHFFAVRAGIWPVTLMVDPNFANVSLRLPFAKSNGSTVFTDYSPRPKTMTAAGNAQHSNAQFRSYASSLLLDGTGDYVTCPAHTDFDFGTGDFTIEAWIRTSVNSISAGASRTIWRPGANDGQFYLAIGTGNLVFGVGVLTSTVSVTDGNWHHVAACRSGGTLRLFIDGVVSGSIAHSTSVNSAGTCFLGGFDAANGHFHGHIQDFRITKGVGRYTANFNPPGALFMIEGTYNLVDATGNTTIAPNSTAAVQPYTPAAVGENALYFNTAALLTVTAGNSAFLSPGSGDFTFEWFQNRVVSNVVNAVYEATGNGNWNIRWTAATELRIGRLNAGWDVTISGLTIPNQTWVHFAFVRSGGVMALFQNGTRVWTASVGTNWPSGTTAYINADGAGGNQVAGIAYDEMRFSNVARYSPASTTITVPTAAYTVDANTRFQIAF